MRRSASRIAVALALLASPLGARDGEETLPPPLATRPELDIDLAGLDGPAQPLAAPAPTFEEQVLERVNVERANCGAGCPLPPLKHQANLIVAAEEHSESMAVNDYFSHRDFANGCNLPGDRMLLAGYTGMTSWAENIAAGYATPDAVMDAWMASPGHRGNILTSTRRELGVGYFYQAGDLGNVDTDCNSNCTCTDGTPPECGGGSESCSGGPFLRYWTQVFGARGGSSGYPVVIDREAHATSTPLVDLYLYQPPGTGPQMRFANETGAFTAPEAFTNNVLGWDLTPGDGLKTVIAEVTTSSGTFRTCDRIWLDGSGNTSYVFAEGFECDGLAAWAETIGGS